ncbi:VWA domain-containing protein [Nodosilinea sp. AN01ver1]|uniref:VWA domain-containing protein n=1 Tax=Nodosilinea sp. AN01ver1 TaxID=3423362 RepID=UPI003D31A826
MSQSPPLPDFLWNLFLQLRRRGFVVGPQDYEALLLALSAGFGWSSPQALKELCARLWAKSLREQATLFALFEKEFPVEETWQIHLEELEEDTLSHDGLLTPSAKSQLSKLPMVWLLIRAYDCWAGILLLGNLLKASQSLAPGELENSLTTAPDDLTVDESQHAKVQSQRGLPSISLVDIKVPDRPFVFEPQYPVSYREVAQAWRRLRRPVRTGPPIELDIDGTIEQRCRAGVATSLVMRPRMRNVAKVLLLIDRKGSMTPFHGFCDEVCLAMQEAGRFEELPIYYFQNSPAEGADDSVLDSDELEDILFPPLDPILSKIEPLIEGDLYQDRDLHTIVTLETVLQNHASDACVVIISDAGAARKQYSVERLLDTVAFFKALRAYTTRYVWLNPLPKDHWISNSSVKGRSKNTATALARHIPMFPLDRRGLDQAVNVLRGQQYSVERPL